MNEQQTHIRNYTPEDLDPIHALVRAAAEHDAVDPDSTLESLPTKDALQATLEATGDSQQSDVLVATDQETGEILGYGVVRWWQEDDGTFLYLHSGNVHPAHRGHGVGITLLASLQDRIKAIAAEHPADAPKFYGANASSTHTGANELLKKNGYEKVWSMVEMEYTDMASLRKLNPPEGYELRAVGSEDDKRAVYNANKRHYAGRFGASPPSEADYQEFLADSPDSDLWKVLWKDDNVAGFVLSKAEGDKAEIMEVSVMPEYQRRGLGEYLMLESMAELRDRGVDAIRLHTDAPGQRGGRQLYENIGFKTLKEHYRYRKPIEQQSPEAQEEIRIDIAPLERNDLAEVAELAASSFADAFGPSMTQEQLKQSIAEGRSVAYFEKAIDTSSILVAKEQAKIVGYVQYGDVKLPEVEDTPDAQELGRLYVATDQQGKGIGRRLMQTALDDPAMKAAKKIYLQVWEQNTKAIPLYESFGFKTVGVTHFEIAGRPAQDLIMLREQSTDS